MKSGEVLKKGGEILENLFVRYMWLIAVVSSIIITSLYHVRILHNVRDTMSDIITFSSVIFVVLSIILTFLLTLKESRLFKRIKRYFPGINTKLYKLFIKVIYMTVFVLIIALIIIVIDFGNVVFIKVLISLIGSGCFVYMIIGTLYLLRYTADMVINEHKYDVEKQDRKKAAE